MTDFVKLTAKIKAIQDIIDSIDTYEEGLVEVIKVMTEEANDVTIVTVDGVDVTVKSSDIMPPEALKEAVLAFAETFKNTVTERKEMFEKELAELSA